MKQRRFSAVFFDWDLTLAYVTDGDTYIQRLTALFRSQGFSHTDAEVEAAIQKYREESEQEQDALSHSPPQTQAEIARFYAQILARLGHYDVAPELLNRLYNAYGDLPLRLYADCLPTLQALQQQGTPIGVITNHSTTIRPVIERYIGQFVSEEHIIISQEVGFHKPETPIFQYAARQIQAPTAACVFVGDNLTVDAIGAVTEGGFGLGLWLDRLGIGTAVSLPSSVHQITSLPQVLHFVAGSNS